MDNLKIIMANFEHGYQELMNATTALMFRLCQVSYPDIESFWMIFGNSIKDEAILYRTMQQCLGGTQEQVDIHMQYITSNKALKKENLGLKLKLKGLEIKLKLANKKKRKK